MPLNFYTRETIDQAQWPNNPIGELGQAYLMPLIKQGPNHFVDNFHAEMALIVLNDKVLPIYINSGSDRDSHIVSPSCYYFLSGAEEFRHTKKLGYKLLFGLIKSLHHCSHLLNFDKTLQINNWLMPTNPSQSLSREEISQLKEFLKQRYPDYAFTFKSVNPLQSEQTLENFKANAFNLIKTRLVYVWDQKQVISKHRRYLNKDEALNKTHHVLIRPHLDSDKVQPLKALYHQVYSDKYSSYCPEFNDAYFQLFTQSPHIKTIVCEEGDKLHGFYTSIDLGDEKILGIVGHDLEVNEAKGIYRQLFRHCLKEAERTGPINLSGGIGQFKRNRGAKPVAEYEACYVEHLPFRRKMIWKALAWATQQPFMEKIAKDV